MKIRPHKVGSVCTRLQLPPEVEIIAPRTQQIEVPENGEALVEVRAIDPDYALSHVGMKLTAAGRPLADKTLLAGPSQAGQAVSKFRFRPSEFKLRAGDEIAYWATAADNRTAPQTSVALANSGPLQVELIQQRNDAPTMYRDFIDAGRTGLQHVAYWTESFDADLARLTAQGFTIGMSGEVGERGRFVYFETEFHPGSVIELSEVAGPKGKLFRMIRDAASGWDGRDPVRPPAFRGQ